MVEVIWVRLRMVRMVGDVIGGRIGGLKMVE